MSGPSKRRFEVIYREGQRVSTAALRIYSLSGSEQIGYATSRAIGNRPQRNRVRRRIQAAFRELKAELPAGLDLIIQAKAEAKNTSFGELRDQLRNGLEATARRWESKSESS